MIPRLIVDAVAVYRLTRLVTADSIAEPIRDQVVRLGYAWADRPLPDASDRELAEAAMDDPDHPKLVELASCRWCASFWLAVAVVFVRWRWPRAWEQAADVLTFSAVAALLARLED